MADRINGNYKIIESIQATDELEYVIGQNMNNLSQYVTWLYMRERDVYNGGEYCNSLLQARKSLLERALTAVNQAMPVFQPTVPENAISRDVHGERMSFELSGNEMDRIWDIVSQENIVNDIKWRIGQRHDFEGDDQGAIVNANEALIDEIGRRYRSEGSMLGDSFWYTLDAYIDEALPKFQIPRFSKVPLYMQPWDYACLNNERNQYTSSLLETQKCRDDIQRDVREHYDGMHIPVERVVNYVNDYRYDRVMVVLANYIQQHDYDGRISKENVEWARQISVPDAKRLSESIMLYLDAGLVNSITNEVRHLYVQEQSVNLDNTETAPSEDEEYDMEM